MLEKLQPGAGCSYAVLHNGGYVQSRKQVYIVCCTIKQNVLELNIKVMVATIHLVHKF